MRRTPRLRPLSGVGLALSGVLCPCHALAAVAVGGIGLATGVAPALTPALQDAMHALYLPAAFAGGAWLIGRGGGGSAVDVSPPPPPRTPTPPPHG